MLSDNMTFLSDNMSYRLVGFDYSLASVVSAIAIFSLRPNLTQLLMECLISDRNNLTTYDLHVISKLLYFDLASSFNYLTEIVMGYSIKNRVHFRLVQIEKISNIGDVNV